jgi:Glycosyl transferase family 2
MITAILNGYKRPQFLNEQVLALKNQTIPPTEIMLWQNNSAGFDTNITNQLTTAVSNKNLGVWARFAFALNAKTEYVCIFDDDTIPGPLWFENCLNTIKTHEGLLGTIGCVFKSNQGYYPYIRYGWDNPNVKAVKVDIVGHCWFFRKEWLSAYWRELPPTGFEICGEDMHFSYAIQKYLNLGTYVPPHPPDFKEMWGSTKGWEMGREENGISLQPSSIDKMNQYYKILINKGFKIINHG